VTPLRRRPEISEPTPFPSLRPRARVAGSNPGAAVRPSGLLAPHILWPLDCFVARAPRNDGWGAGDPIDSVFIGRRLGPFLRIDTLEMMRGSIQRSDLDAAIRWALVPANRLAISAEWDRLNERD
jgi:hypothetical protein